MKKKHQQMELDLPARPWRLYVDPEFDLMRRLDRHEIPPSLSQIFGAEQAAIVLPATARKELREGYYAIAKAWTRHGDVQLLWDDQIKELPTDRGVWLLGWENRFCPRIASALTEQSASLSDEGVKIDGQTYPRAENGMVMVMRHPANPDLPVAWLAYDRLEGLPGLARKIRHYGTYSYLAFTGDAPDNVLKGQWPVVNSPLQRVVIQADAAAAPDQHPVFAGRRALTDVLPGPKE